MTQNIKVYLDLDGVMVDLDKKIKQIFGAEYKDIPSKELWDKLGDIDHLFLNLDPMPNYKTLFNYLKSLENKGIIKLEILTSLPYSTKKLVTSKQDKIAWVRKYLDPDIIVNTVVGGVKKSRFATTEAILIDDLPRNIESFKSAGGTGILHRSAPKTIVELEKIIADMKSL